jgi:hypothetical protein
LFGSSLDKSLLFVTKQATKTCNATPTRPFVFHVYT